MSGENLDALSPDMKIITVKKAMRQVAKDVRNSILTATDRSRKANIQTAMYIARAVWHSDSWLAKILLD
eukprot:9133612-Alexandrium_andersonii.AAC.1